MISYSRRSEAIASIVDARRAGIQLAASAGMPKIEQEVRRQGFADSIDER